MDKPSIYYCRQHGHFSTHICGVCGGWLELDEKKYIDSLPMESVLIEASAITQERTLNHKRNAYVTQRLLLEIRRLNTIVPK